MRNTYPKYHQTTRRIEFLAPLSNRFRFLRQNLSSCGDTRGSYYNFSTVDSSQNASPRENQSPRTFVEPKVLRRLPRLRIINLQYSTKIHLFSLALLERNLNSNKNAKLNLFINLRDFVNRQIPRSLKKYKGFVINSPTNLWFTQFSHSINLFMKLSQCEWISTLTRIFILKAFLHSKHSRK